MNTSSTRRISSEATQKPTLPLSKEGILRSQVLINIRSSTTSGPQQHQVLIILLVISKEANSHQVIWHIQYLGNPHIVIWSSSMQQQHPYDTITISTRCNNNIHNARQHYSQNALTQHCSTHSALSRHCSQCTSSTLHNALVRHCHMVH